MSEVVKAAAPGGPTPLPASPAPVTASTGGSASGSGTGSTLLLQTPPPALSALTNGQIIRAIAAGVTSDSKALLDTRFGQIALALPMEISRGQVLRLQIVRAGTPLELTLLSAGDPEGGTTPPADFTRLRPGDPLSGQFRPAVPARMTAEAPGALNVKQSAAPNGSAIQATPALRGDHPAAVASDSKATPLNLRLLSVIPPGKPLLPASTNALVVTGMVVANKAGSGVLLQTAAGNLLLPGVTNAPAGAQVTLQIVATPGTVLPATATGAQTRSISSLTQGWPALLEAIEATKALAPGQAAAIIASSLPTTGPTLTAGLALFLNAVFGAKMHDWLGRDLIRGLAAHRLGELANRLGDDFAELARFAGEPLGNEWRSVTVPLMHDGALHQIRLYLRDQGGRGQGHNGDDGTREAGAGTRFVVEVELSKLGALQLDGLVRPERFDLMVRTHRDLPPAVRNEIATLFAAANAEMNAFGQIAFQVTRDFPVRPLEDADIHTVGMFA